MKKMILFLTLALGFAFGATEVKLIGNEKGSIPVMRQLAKTDVVIDTSEVDTSTVYFNLIDDPFTHYGDTLGQVFMRCDDSAGTDTVGGRLIWEGNPRTDGKQLWERIDSVAILAGTGVETLTSKAVVNAKRFMSIRFLLRNQLLPAAGKKTVCRDITLNLQRRLVD